MILNLNLNLNLNQKMKVYVVGFAVVNLFLQNVASSAAGFGYNYFSRTNTKVHKIFVKLMINCQLPFCYFTERYSSYIS